MPWTERIGRRIKLRDLHILAVTAESGSMAKAAASLSVSQPSISYAIAGLEDALGVPLLDRMPQGVTPTAYGRALIERSTAAFNELRQGVSEIDFLADPARGELWMGTTPPMSAVASLVINELAAAHPRIVFHLVTETTTVLERHLRQRNIELAISRIAGSPSDEDLAVEKLFDDSLAVMASKENPLGFGRKIELSELLGERWVLPSPSSFLGNLIAGIFRAHGLDCPQAVVDTVSTHAIALLVSSGPFLTIQPQTMLAVPRKHASLVALPVDLKAARNPVALMTLKHRALSPVAKLFIDTARSALKSARRRRG